jgi:hypothetical protein
MPFAYNGRTTKTLPNITWVMEEKLNQEFQEYSGSARRNQPRAANGMK